MLRSRPAAKIYAAPKYFQLNKEKEGSMRKHHKEEKSKSSVAQKFLTFTVVAGMMVVMFMMNAGLQKKQNLRGDIVPTQRERHKTMKRKELSLKDMIVSKLPPSSIYQLAAIDIQGVKHHLSQYAGFVSLVVNVASE